MTDKMNILALDPATKCGYAVTENCSGVWDLSAKRDESVGMRLVKFKKALDKIHRQQHINLVVFEAARNAGPRMQGALVVQAELQGVLKIWCETNEVDYTAVSPTEVKKHATGKGNANKEQMVDAAIEMFDVAIVDDNHADALWILHLAKTRFLNEGVFE